MQKRHFFKAGSFSFPLSLPLIKIETSNIDVLVKHYKKNSKLTIMIATDESANSSDKILAKSM